MQEDGEIECPQCLKVHRYSEDVANLPVASYVYSVIELKEKLNKSEARERNVLAQALEMEKKIGDSLKLRTAAEEILIAIQNLENTAKQLDCELPETNTNIRLVEFSKNSLAAAGDSLQVCNLFL